MQPFGKRINETYVAGLTVSHTDNQKAKNKKYFDKLGWKNWLDYLRVFHKNYDQINTSRIANLAPLFVENNLDNRPFISVNLFGEEVIALLDSGANISVVGSSGMPLIRRYGLQINNCSQRNISTADGFSQFVSGTVDLPLYINNTCHIIRALIVPSIKHSLILGSDFCKKFLLQIDYKNNSWTVQSREFPGNLAIVNSVNIDTINDLCSLDNLSQEERVAGNRIIDSFKEINGEKYFGRTSKISLNIDTGNSKPIKQRQYPLSPYMSNILNKELDSMLELGVVEPSQSPWCSPVLLVKKSSGEYRFCFDGRKLNAITKHDSYPLPRVDRILSMLHEAKFISSVDLRKAFWQIPLDKSSKEKTAFAIPGRGLYQFCVVPFGLCNSAQTQQRLMDAVFGPKYEPNIFVYLDDIIIVSNTFEQHLKLLEEVKERLRDANLTINIKKCEFFKTSLKYLGYVVDYKGLRTDPDKVAAMVNYPRPTTTTEIKRFIGMCSWYRRFIAQFSSLVSPINDLLKGKKRKQGIDWTEEAERSFIKIKEALVSAPILCSPDFTKPFIIQSDASDVGIGGVLTQNIEGTEKVIAFASRSLTRAERIQPITQRECLAVIFCIEKFRPFVEGTRFTVITDHFSLIWLHNLQNPCGKLSRWALKLQQYSFDLVHRKGKLNVVPDALSRIVHPEITTLSIDLRNLDKYYIDLRGKISQNPELYPKWKIENKFVYKLCPNTCNALIPTNLSEWKLLIPRSQRIDVMKTCHEPPTCAHFGFYKTFSRIQELYYWPKMRQDILKYVKSCRMCGAQKCTQNARMGLMGSEKTVNYPWQIIATDILGPLPRSKRGNCFLLVVTDWFTKYSLLYPMKKATAEIIVKFVENEVFLVFGVPQFIICDNGTQFAGKVFKKLANTYEVQKIWYNARYHPQCNFVERVNRTIGAAIRSYVKDHKDWDQEIKKISYAMNTAKHESTGYPPAYLNFGRYVPISGKYYGEITSTENVDLLPDDRDKYISKLKGLSEIFVDVKQKLHAAYSKNASTYNLRRKNVEFTVGDKVWKRNKVLSDATRQFASKLAPKYVLCKITRKISRLVYSLSNTDGSYAGEWHIKDLKPYLGSNSDVSVGQ